MHSIVLAVLVFATAFASAEEAAPAEEKKPTKKRPPDPSIEEIVVEGEREEVTLQESTHSITVFTEEKLRRSTERNMEEIFIRVPNVATDPFSGDVIVRGVALNGINVRGFAGINPNVTGFIDGFFTPSQQALWDTRQVEVLRGQQNFVGGGAYAGRTSVTSKNPTDPGDGQISMSWSPEPDERAVGVAYGGPVTDTVGVRGAVYMRARDGFTENLTRNEKDWNSLDESMARLRVDWSPGGREDTEAMLRIEHLKNTYNGTTVIYSLVPDVDPFDRETRVDTRERDEEESMSARFRITHRVDERWSTDLIVGWADVKDRGIGDRDGTDQPFGNFQYHYDRDYAGWQLRVFYDDDVWQGYFRQAALWLDVSNSYSNNNLPVDLDGGGPTPSVMANVQYFSPTSNWWYFATQAGGRREFGRLGVAASVLHLGQLVHGDRGVSSTRTTSTGIPPLDAFYDSIIANPNFFPHAEISDDTKEFEWLPTYVVDFAIADDMTIGAKYERGLRFGGFWFNVARQTVNRYESEEADTYDIFLRASSSDASLSARVNAFYTRIEKQQIYAQLTSAAFDAEFVNAQRSHVEGVELEVDWRLRDWTLWASAGLLRTQFDRVEVPGISWSGNEFPNAPDWTASLGFLYQHPRGLFAASDVSMRPQTQATADNRRGVVNEERTLANARLGWAFNRAEVSIYARNLLDEDYLAYHDADIAFGGTGRFQTDVPGTPREVGFTLYVSL